MSGQKRGNRTIRGKIKLTLEEMGGKAYYKEFLDYYNKNDRYGLTIYQLSRLANEMKEIRVEGNFMALER